MDGETTFQVVLDSFKMKVLFGAIHAEELESLTDLPEVPAPIEMRNSISAHIVPVSLVKILAVV